MRSETREEVVCLSIVMLLLAGAALNAQTFPDRARVFPQLIAALALVLCGIELLRQVVRGRAGAVSVDGEAAERPRTWAAQLRLGIPYLLWIGALYLGMFLVGYLAASFVFVALFLRRVASLSWARSLVSSALLVTVLLTLGRFLHMVWPEGLVQRLTGFG
jgi:hypothetical protein